MPMIFLISKAKMQAIVRAAYHINVIKKINADLNSVAVFLSIVKEGKKPIVDLHYKLLARKAILERFLNKHIELIIQNHNYTMAYEFKSISKKQLEDGYVNLSTKDGEDNDGDVILSLLNGDVFIISELQKPQRVNALIYHDIIKV
ncbi:MAG: hypothetical protein ACP5OA_03495 [Candidatus Woesearchaeota archaeon]